MASKLLKVFEEIEHGRKLCIDRAQEAGFDIDRNAGFDTLADCFNEITPDYIPANVEYPHWVRPDYLPDLKTILQQAENKTDNGVIVYPLYAVSFSDDDTNILINSYMFCGLGSIPAAQRIGVYTSDGIYYSAYTDPALPHTGSLIEHTWNSNKHYIIVYGSEIYTSMYNNGTGLVYRPDGNGLATQLIGTNNITQICFDKVYMRGMTTGYSTSQYKGLENTWRSLESTNNTKMPTWDQNLNLGDVVGLEYVSLPTLINITNNFLTGGSSNLYEVNLPNLENIAGTNVYVLPMTYRSADGYKNKGFVKILNIPKLKKLGTSSSYVNGSIFTGYVNPSLDLSNLSVYNINTSPNQSAHYSAFQNLQYIKLGPVYCYEGSASWGRRFELNVSNFDYAAGANFGQILLPRIRSYTFKEPCHFMSFSSSNVRFVDFSECEWDLKNERLYLGSAPVCQTVVFPNHISHANIDISDYPNLDNDSLEDLIEKLPESNGYTITMSDYCKKNLTQEQLQEIHDLGWEVI